MATRPAVATATTAKPSKLNHRLLIKLVRTSYPKEAIAIPPVIMTSQTIQCIALREPRAAQLPIFALLAIDASQLPFGETVQLSQRSSYLSIQPVASDAQPLGSDQSEYVHSNVRLRSVAAGVNARPMPQSRGLVNSTSPILSRSGKQFTAICS